MNYDRGREEWPLGPARSLGSSFLPASTLFARGSRLASLNFNPRALTLEETLPD